jgi:hypothetical protein
MDARKCWSVLWWQQQQHVSAGKQVCAGTCREVHMGACIEHECIHSTKAETPLCPVGFVAINSIRFMASAALACLACRCWGKACVTMQPAWCLLCIHGHLLLCNSLACTAHPALSDRCVLLQLMHTGAGASLWLERDSSGPWRFHWTDTQRAWLDEFDGAHTFHCLHSLIATSCVNASPARKQCTTVANEMSTTPVESCG